MAIGPTQTPGTAGVGTPRVASGEMIKMELLARSLMGGAEVPGTLTLCAVGREREGLLANRLSWPVSLSSHLSSRSV